jgi:hypothetical protein
MARDLDLLGDPIPEGHGEPGRPEHIPTVQNRNKVRLLLAMGHTQAKVAAALDVDPKTLRKHYSPELQSRRRARAVLEGALTYAVAAKALEGDVPAYREMRKLLDKVDQAETDASLRGAAPKPERAPRLGKKEERQQAAEEIGGIFAPGAAPAGVLPH